MKSLIIITSVLSLLASCGNKVEEKVLADTSQAVYEDELKLSRNNTITDLVHGDELLIELEAFDLVPRFEVEDRYVYGFGRDDCGCWVKWRNFAGTMQESVPTAELIKDLKVFAGGDEYALDKLIIKKVYWNDEDSDRVGLLIRVDETVLNGDHHIEIKSTPSSKKVSQKLGFMSWAGHCKWIREITDDGDAIRSMTEHFFIERVVKIKYRVYRK